MNAFNTFKQIKEKKTKKLHKDEFRIKQTPAYWQIRALMQLYIDKLFEVKTRYYAFEENATNLSLKSVE